MKEYNFTDNLLNTSLKDFPSGTLLYSANFLLVSDKFFPKNIPHGMKKWKYIHTYIPYIHFVKGTVGCGTRHKYTNIHNFYSIKYYKHFTK